MTTEEELRLAQAELEEYDRDVRGGLERYDGAYRRALRLRIEMLEERPRAASASAKLAGRKSVDPGRAGDSPRRRAGRPWDKPH
jgi:hypothetical protein